MKGAFRYSLSRTAQTPIQELAPKIINTESEAPARGQQLISAKYASCGDWRATSYDACAY